MKNYNIDDLVYRIEESLTRDRVGAEELDEWLDANTSNQNIPDYIWDIINAVARNI